MNLSPIKMLLFICCFLFLFVGCQNSSDISKPILMRGFVRLDKSIESTYKPDTKPYCKANVQIVNTSSDKVVAQTDVDSIADFPFMYIIRQDFYKTYQDYWDNYSIFAYIYDSTSDSKPSLKGSTELDLYNYNYKQDITVK